MKKILIFSSNYYPRFVGGAEVAIKEITDRIDPTEIEFHMVTPRFDSNLATVEKIGNVLVHRIGFASPHPSMKDLKTFPLHFNKHLFQILAAWKALSLHKNYHYDGVWAMMAHSCGIPAGLFKLVHPHVKYLLTLQEGDPPEKIERMMAPVFPLFANAFTRADYLQAISTFLFQWGTRMGFAGEGIVIPNGVDTARFGSVSPRAEGEGTILVTTSRLVHKNALDDVIRALPLLPDTTFVIYGIGPDEEKLKALAEELNVVDRTLFKGEIGHADMPHALAACDIFIRPSRSEGMGNSFIEAMAASLPVIATQEGGIADFLFDVTRNPMTPPTGWAVDANAPAQIAKAVRAIRENPEKTREVTARAKAMVYDKYNWDLIAPQMRDLFARMVH